VFDENRRAKIGEIRKMKTKKFNKIFVKFGKKNRKK
jgi:hypothetical protein